MGLLSWYNDRFFSKTRLFHNDINVNTQIVQQFLQLKNTARLRLANVIKVVKLAATLPIQIYRGDKKSYT